MPPGTAPPSGSALPGRKESDRPGIPRTTQRTEADGRIKSEDDCRGITPRKTKFETQKDYLRNAIDEAAASARSLEEFQKQLSDSYRITLKISRGRFSYLHPERGKYITGRNLGTHYEKEYLLSVFKENTRSRSDISSDFSAFIFIKSDLRLVRDLQTCVKAQESPAYARRVKLTNLQPIRISICLYTGAWL